jgi:tetratricopeptide (TPR) repeat protein
MEENVLPAENLPQIISTHISPNISDLFKKGMHDYRHHDFTAAVEIFQSIISTNPDLPEAQVNLGNAYFRMNKIQEAISCWKTALSMDSTQVSCYINIGNAYFASNNIHEAIKHWLAALAIAPDHTTALLNLGSVYESQNDMIQAFKYYDEYLRFHQKDKSTEFQKIYSKVVQSKQIAQHNLKAGFYYQKRDRLKKAAMCYIRSIKSYPNLPKAYLNLGSICYMGKQYEHAVKYWKQALKIDPSYDNTYCNMGVAYEFLNKPDQAFCMYKKFIAITNKSSFQAEERLKELALYVEKHPEAGSKCLEKAESLYSKQKYMDALWEYENYILLKPDQKSSYEARINEIKNYINPILKASNTAFEIGNTCFSQSKFDKAIQAYKRYLLLNPDGEHSKEAKNKISDCARYMNRNLNKFSRVSG